MSGKFEATIVDADRNIEFDVEIQFEGWSEYGSRRYAVTGVGLLAGRVAMKSDLCSGRVNVVWCDMEVNAIGPCEFGREYAAELTDAMMDHVASLEDACADYQMEFAGV